MLDEPKGEDAGAPNGDAFEAVLEVPKGEAPVPVELLTGKEKADAAAGAFSTGFGVKPPPKLGERFDDELVNDCPKENAAGAAGGANGFAEGCPKGEDDAAPLGTDSLVWGRGSAIFFPSARVLSI